MVEEGMTVPRHMNTGRDFPAKVEDNGPVQALEP